MVEFFELRNLVSQMVSDAKLLELVDQASPTSRGVQCLWEVNSFLSDGVLD